jgi:hypothetical protein|tara:strand:+ start:127 stop:651 length:525 start_codon:yes stop_codon:yes gene_type:complete
MPARKNLTNTVKKTVAASQEWKCKHCSNILDECYEIDHIICVKDGGTNDVSNLQALCPNCHRKKTGKDIQKLKITEKPPSKKIELPPWWNSSIGEKSTFLKNITSSQYPHLTWNSKITNFNKYTVNELKIMLVTMNGEVRNGTKKEIIFFITDGAKSYNQIVTSLFNPPIEFYN